MPRVYYWEKALAQNVEEFRGCEKQIAALLSGQYQTAGLDTKKPRGYTLFTARINDTHRLLFTTIKANGKSCLLLLEVIENHDYQKSKYLKNPALLNKFLDHQVSDAAPPLESITEDFFSESAAVPIDRDEAKAESKNELSISDLDLQPAVLYQNNFIILNAEQESVKHAAMPLIVSGLAGSGKTCTALEILKQEAPRQIPEEKNPLYYVCKSPELAKHMAKTWNQMPEISAIKPEHRPDVRFVSYQGLLEQASCEDKREVVGEEQFTQWYKTQGNKTKKNNPLSKFTPDLIYQEMQICSSVESEAQYLQIGRKNTLLGEGQEEAMHQVYALYENYKKTLLAQRKINPDFYVFEALPACLAMVVDEAQGLTPVQLDNLWRMSQRRIAYCLDTHQSLSARKSILPYLERLTERNLIQLPLCYRSGKAVITLANGIIELRDNLVGGTAVKNELCEIKMPKDHSLPEGGVHWLPLEAKDSDELDRIKASYKETEAAVVAWPSDLEAARKRFPTLLIFTPAQIIGLEYKLIIAFRPLDQDIFKEASTKLSKMDLKTVSARPKGAADDSFGPPLNQLFTLVTRAMETLVFIQDKPKKIKALADTLQGFIGKKETLAELPPAPKAKETRPEDWRAQAQVLLESNNEEQAKWIFTEKLKETNQAYEVFKSRILGQPAKPAKVPPEQKIAPKQAQVPALNALTQSVDVPPQELKEIKQAPKMSKALAAYMERYLKDAKKPGVASKNIANIFDKPELLNKTLFTAQTPEGLSLFEFLISEQAAIFSEFLFQKPKTVATGNFFEEKKEKTAKEVLIKFVNRELCIQGIRNQLYHLSLNCKNGLLCFFLDNLTDLRQSLTAQDWLKPASSGSILELSCPLAKLLKNDIGINIFLDQLNTYPKDQVFEEKDYPKITFILRSSIASGIAFETSYFELMAYSQSGRKALMRLMLDHKLFAYIKLRGLDLCSPGAARGRALDGLLQDDNGKRFLVGALLINPAIVNEVPDSDLYSIVSIFDINIPDSREHLATFISLNSRTLILLLMEEQNTEILLKMFEDNPSIALKMTLDPEVFKFLAGNLNYHALLLKILQINPKLAQELEGDDLFGPNNSFTNLVPSIAGRQTLNSIFAANPKLAEYVIPAIILQVGKTLAEEEEGQKLLLKLAASNPALEDVVENVKGDNFELLQEQLLEHLEDALAQESPNKINQFFGQYLQINSIIFCPMEDFVRMPDKFLYILRNHEETLSLLDERKLATALSIIPLWNKRPLLNTLLETREGIEVLALLLKHKPDIARLINSQIWLIKGDDKDSFSSFAELAANDTHGHDILMFLLKENPMIAGDMTRADLLQANIVDNLEATPVGREVLERLGQINAHLRPPYTDYPSTPSTVLIGSSAVGMFSKLSKLVTSSFSTKKEEEKEIKQVEAGVKKEGQAKLDPFNPF